MSESCEIYIKPHVACNVIDVALEGHSGMLPASSLEYILRITTIGRIPIYVPYQEIRLLTVMKQLLCICTVYTDLYVSQLLSLVHMATNGLACV